MGEGGKQHLTKSDKGTYFSKNQTFQRANLIYTPFFNPKAQFVCCRENPELHPPKPVVPLESTDHEIVIEAASSSTKGIVVY